MPAVAKKSARTSRGRKLQRDPDEVFQGALEMLRRDSAVKLTTLGPPAARIPIVERLREAGYEVTRSYARRNLSEQLAEVLADGAFVPLKDVKVLVSGATATEVKAQIAALTKRGTAQVVLRTKVETLVPGSTATLSRVEVKQLKAALEPLTKQLSKVATSKSSLSLLLTDVSEALRDAVEGTTLADALSSSKGNGSKTPDSPAATVLTTREQVLNAIDATFDEQVGLSFVPDVLKRLAPEMDLTAAQAALLSVAQLGLVELRPEGGLGRLSDAELLVCPPGPEGTRLSWARRVEGAKA
jgi:hypothetical protein